MTKKLYLQQLELSSFDEVALTIAVFFVSNRLVNIILYLATVFVEHNWRKLLWKCYKSIAIKVYTE